MKLQIVEPMAGGHHTNYLRALLPAVRQLMAAGAVEQTVLTVPADLAAQLAGDVDGAHPRLYIDASLPQVPPNPSFLQRLSMYRSRTASMRRVAADAILFTSADYDVMVEALYAFGGLRRCSRAGARVAGMLHFGFPRQGPVAWGERLKRLVYDSSCAAVDWDHLLIVNPLVYTSLRARPGSDPRMQLQPDPVPMLPAAAKFEARRALGLPAEGRYIGHIGMMDDRKAIPELVRAFLDAQLAPDVRLLLAGQMAESHRQFLREQPAARDGERILVIDRPLDERELVQGYRAVDVHGLFQYRRVKLSSNGLKAAASGAPIVADAFGHLGWLVQSFAAGITCNIHDRADAARALREAVALAGAYQPGEALTRLLGFHAVENYARVALCAVLGKRASAVLGDPVTWEFATTGLSPYQPRS